MQTRRLGGAVVKGIVAVFAVVGIAAAVLSIPGVNLFDEKEVDRTGATVLNSLVPISEFRAARAHYETIVDLEGESVLPDWLKGERLLYVAKGTVDAYVDFGEMDERRIVVAADGSVTVTLPQPTVSEPILDLETSYIADHDKGLMSKFSGSDIEHRAQLEGIEQMKQIATGEDLLLDLAKANTEDMLRGMFAALKHPNVTVLFDE